MRKATVLIETGSGQKGPASPQAPCFRPLLEQERQLFLICFLTQLAIWSSHLVLPTYSIDDYILLRGHAGEDLLRYFVAQGRFGEAALHTFLVQLGVDPVHAFGVVNLAAIGLLSFGAVWLMRTWRLAPRAPSTALVATLIFAHPFASEVWTFRLTPSVFGAAVALATAGLSMARTYGMRVLPVALMTLSFSLYQVGFHILLVAVAIGLLLAALRSPATQRPVRELVRDWLPTLGCVLLACLVYVALNAAVQRVLGIEPAARGALMTWGDVPSRLGETRDLFSWIFGNDTLSTPLLNGLVIGLLLGAVAAVIRCAIQLRSPALAALAVAVLAAALFAVPGVTLLLHTWWPAARTLTAMGVLCAGALAICLVAAPARLRWVPAAAGGLLLFGFAGVDARVATEQQRINALDREVAREILEHLESDPQVDTFETLVSAGAPATYPLFQAYYRDLNVSALSVRWTIPFLIEELLGRPLRMPSSEEAAVAEAHCVAAPRWPRAGSVTVIGVVGVACF